METEAGVESRARLYELAPPSTLPHLQCSYITEDPPMSVMLPPLPPASELPEPEPPAKHCDQCAAVKRQKGSTSSDGLTAWHARPCVQCSIVREGTGPQVPPGGVSSLCMRSAIKEDLQPRRLFDFGSEESVEEPEFEISAVGTESYPWEASMRTGNASPAFPVPGPSAQQTPMMAAVDFELTAMSPPSASMNAHGSELVDATSESLDIDELPHPPLLPASSGEAAAAARDAVACSPSSRMSVMQSPGLAYAAARMIMRDGPSSSCATPSRTPGPGRPATPGAPGSNVRRTTSFIDGIETEEEGVEGFHSMTDTVLIQLTQSLTSITLGSKRTFDERG